MNSLINRTNKIIKNMLIGTYKEFLPTLMITQNALEISNDALRMVSLKHLSNGKLKLLDAKTIYLDEKAFKDDKFNQITSLSSQVVALIDQSSVKPESVSISIPVNRIISQSILLDKTLNDAQIETSIVENIEKSFPYQLNQIYYDWQVVEQLSNLKENHILFVVSHQDVIDQYVSLCNLVGLELNTVDINHYVLYRLMDKALWQNDQIKEKRVLLININQSDITVTKLEHNVIPSFCETTQVNLEQKPLESYLPWIKRTIHMAISGAKTKDSKVLYYLSGDYHNLEKTKQVIETSIDIAVELFDPFTQLEIDTNAVDIDNPYQYLIPLGLALRVEV